MFASRAFLPATGPTNQLIVALALIFHRPPAVAARISFLEPCHTDRLLRALVFDSRSTSIKGSRCVKFSSVLFHAIYSCPSKIKAVLENQPFVRS